MKPDGEPVELIFPTDNPSITKATLKLGETFIGDVDLRSVIRDPSVMKKSDVLLFWAYKSPKALRIPRWSGALVVIPQQSER